jgi:hypothetical protein
LFIATFAFSIGLGTVTPVLPERALETQLVFVLCTLVICMAFLSARQLALVSSACILVMLPLFLFSYYQTNQIFSSYSKQQQVVASGILTQQLNKSHTIMYPLLFDRASDKTLGLEDITDPWHSQQMAKYYGVENMQAFDAGFDYSIINKDCEFENKTKRETGDISLCVRSYEDVRPTRNTFVLEFDQSSIPKDRVYSLTINTDRGQNKPYQFMFNGNNIIRNMRSPYPAIPLSPTQISGRNFFHFITNYFLGGPHIISIDVAEKSISDNDGYPVSVTLN